MRKLTAILVFIFLASILITGGSPKKYSCDIVKKSVEELPKLNITIGGHKIEYIAEKNIWDGIKYDPIGNFPNINE